MEREIASRESREPSGSGSSAGDHLNSSLNSSIEELHIKAEEYLEREIDKLNEEQLQEIVEIDNLVKKSCASGDFLIGLKKAARSLSKESESELIDIKLVEFLEEVYHALPITKYYTAEDREETFKTAIGYTIELLGEDKEDLLHEMYPDYFESGC